VRGERRGMAGTPRTRAVSVFHLRSGLSADFDVGDLSKWAGIGLHTYTDVQWNVTTFGSYIRTVRQTERPTSPDTPAFRFCADLRIPIPPMSPASLAPKQTPGRESASGF
jgi:hypothetical protein